MSDKKFDYTEVKDADNVLREIVFMPSTLETIDFALYRYVDEVLNLHVNTNKGFKKAKVLWSSTERGYQIRHDQTLRDFQGRLILPLITIERDSYEKDPSFKGSFQAHIPEKSNEPGRRTIVASRRIKQDKTANFNNADSQRKRGAASSPAVGHGQLNFPIHKKAEKVVFETIYQPLPTWLKMQYKITLRAEYQQQANTLLTPFVTIPGQINNFFIEHEGHRYEGFIEGTFSNGSNSSNQGTEERMFETTINVRVLGYLMGEGENGEKPKISIEENYVEVKIPRERTITGDLNTFIKKGFYRE
jgi:hypothetical protein